MPDVDLTSDLPVWRFSAAHQLREVVAGKNLHDLAAEHSVTVHKAGRLNKGWVGQTLERIARLTAGCAQSPDGIGFELKSTSLLPSVDGWKPKEILRITQLSPQVILDETFETSALWNKLTRILIVGCHHESPTVCRAVKVSTFDLEDPELLFETRSFWETVRMMVSLGEIADITDRGMSGTYLQIRPTGDGKGLSTCPVTGLQFPSRAFYGNKRLVQRLLAI